MWIGAAVACSSKKSFSFPSTAAAKTQNAAAASTHAVGLRALSAVKYSRYAVDVQAQKLVADHSASVQSTNLQWKPEFKAIVKIHRFIALIARRITVLRQNITQLAQEYVWIPTRRQLPDPLSKMVANCKLQTVVYAYAICTKVEVEVEGNNDQSTTRVTN